MTASGPSDYASFARRKEQAALSARLESFTTVADNSADFSLDSVRCDFTAALLDGPFFQSPVPPGRRPLVNLVFVESRDGNTGTDDPSTLGGGETDKHVIYEGLTRVCADAVMAGAKTVGDGGLLFSVWHPELVELRRRLGKPRHPVQIVTTVSGHLPIDGGLLFNVPDVPVVIVSGGRSGARLVERTGSRPWISVVDTDHEPDLQACAERLRRDFGIRRISAVGGRHLATSLLDARLVTDLYVTTSPVPGGVPGTPLYVGSRPPARALVVSKRSSEGAQFDHFVLRDGSPVQSS